MKLSKKKKQAVFFLSLLVVFITAIIIDVNYGKNWENQIILSPMDSLNEVVIETDYNRGVLSINNAVKVYSAHIINTEDYKGLLDIALYETPFHIYKKTDNDTIWITRKDSKEFLVFKKLTGIQKR